RLEQYPRLFKQIRETLNPTRVPPVHAETAIKQNKGVLSIIEDMVRPHMAKLKDADREKLEKAIAAVTAEVDTHQKWLDTELRPKAGGSAPIGPKLFDEKLAFTLGTQLSRAEIRERAEFELKRVRTEMYLIARRLQPDANRPEVPSAEHQQKA